MLIQWREWLDAIFRRDPGRSRTGVRPGVEILEARNLPSVNVLASFAGPMNYTDGGTPVTPPDSIIAVGPNSILSAVNSEMAIQSKNGTAWTGITPFSSFFGTAAAGDFFSDPYVLYDDLAGRFYVGALEINSAGTSDSWDFAMSRTSDPTDFTSNSWMVVGRWTSISEGGADFSDFPKMGWNADAVFVSFNQFPNNGGPVHDLILSISKQTILSGGQLQRNVNYFETDVQTDSGLGNGDHRILIPARMHGNQPGNLEYFVQQDQDLTFTSQSTVNVVAMQNYLTTSPAFTTTTISVNPYKNSPGVTQLTSQIDDRMLSADWDNNLLVAAQDIGTATVPADNLARWYEFSTAGAAPTLAQQGNIDFGLGIDTSFPAIAINPSGAIGLTFILSGPNSSQDPSVYIAGWQPGDALGTMQTPVLVQAGVAGAPAGQRGGDYAAAEYDPTDGTFWAVNEYNIDSRSTDDWGTWIAQFDLGPNPNVLFVSNVYEQLLHRAVDPGSAYWVNLLNSGAAPSTVVLGIEQSPEYLTDLLASLYQHYLGRTPDAGAQFWVNQLIGGASIESVTANIVSSPEYFADKGSSDTGFLDGLYQDILGRSPDSAGLNSWLAFLNNTGFTDPGTLRYQAAMGFLTSPEYRTDLVESYYSAYLGRSADAGGLASWLQALQSGLSDQTVLAAIFGSAEGYAKWS